MITPVVAVDRALMSTDGACAHISVEVDLGAGEPFRFAMTVPELTGTDDHYYSDPLLVFLSYDLAEVDQHEATITASLEDDEIRSNWQAAVLLENRN